MHSKSLHRNTCFSANLWQHEASFGTVLKLLFLYIFVALFAIVSAQQVQAQTFSVIYNFTGGADGTSPIGGLTMDADGNLYGTTASGGIAGGNCYNGCGVVFKLSHTHASWVLTVLYRFRGGEDGRAPASRLIIGPDGSLYGTTSYGGLGTCYYQQGCGTVFRLKPQTPPCATILCNWIETVLYRFRSGLDGDGPGEIALDSAGDLYGVTWGGGLYGRGAVFKLTPSNGGWTKSLIYNFRESDGGSPRGLIFDGLGNLYGATGGTIYQLQPAADEWIENVLHRFNGYDGADVNPLMFDSYANLYGTTGAGGCCQGGAAFKLSRDNNGWSFDLLYSFLGNDGGGWGFGGPSGRPVMDSVGNLYLPTRYEGAYQQGNIFMLSPSDTGWVCMSVHDFTGGQDGAQPYGTMVFTNGTLYGSTLGGGRYSRGAIFEITP